MNRDANSQRTEPADRALWERWAAMRDRVVGALVARGLSEADAEDVHGQALLRAWEARHRLTRPEAAEAWFWTLAHRLAIDEGRRLGRRRGRVDSGALDTLPAAEPADEPCACSLTALAALPEPTRTLVRAVDLDGTSVHDVARRVGITPNAASVRLYRARRALRRRLLEQCGTSSVAECQGCGCAPPPEDQC